MDDPVIRVEGLGKRYRIGEHGTYGLLRNSLSRMVPAPLRNPFRGRDAARDRETGPGGPPQWIWALKDVTFDVAAGQVVGVVGRNGAGKSTLLKILARVTVPTEGRVEMRGEVSSMLEVGIGFHPELTGRENVYLSGSILGMPRRRVDRVFDTIVGYAEIDPFIDTPVKFYSSGMTARLGFAVVAHLEAEVLLIDEILSVGDLAFRQKSFNTIKGLREAGRTILLVTHNVGMLGQLADRCVYIKEGAVHAIGYADDVLAIYKKDVLGASGQGDKPGLPNVFLQKVRDPRIAIDNVTLTGAGVKSGGRLVAGQPVTLSLDLTAGADVVGADLCIQFYRDGRAVRNDHSRPRIGGLSLKRGECCALDITYAPMSLAKGDFTLVLFVRPDPEAKPHDAISEFKTLRLAVEGDGSPGGGLVHMPQSWQRRDGPAAEPDS